MRLAEKCRGWERMLFLAIAGILPLLTIGLLTRSLQAQEVVVSGSAAGSTLPSTVFQEYGCRPGASIDEQSSNLAPNEGFELKIPNPSNWVEGGDGEDYKDYLDWDCLESRSGVCSARIDGRRRGQSLMWRTHSYTIKLPDGYEYYSYYVFSGFVKSTLREGEAYIKVRFYDEDGQKIKECSTQVITGSTSEKWEKLSGIVEAPGAHYARIECRLDGTSSGTVWFDDIHLGLATALSISKGDRIEEVRTGGLITYTVVYTNVGWERGTRCEIVDEPDRYAPITDSSPPPDKGHNWYVDVLSPTVSGTLFLTAQVASDTHGRCTLLNRVNVKCDEIVLWVTGIETTPISPLDCPDGCSISLDPFNPYRFADPGTRVSHPFWLQNNGGKGGRVDLGAHSSQGFTVTIEPSPPMRLEPGGGRRITATVEVPDDARVVMDTTSVTATLECDGGGVSEDSESVTTTVNHVPYVDIEPDRKAYCDRTITFTHVVTNAGNSDDQFSLNCGAGCLTCTCTVDPMETPPLAPGESVEVTATVDNVLCGQVLQSDDIISETLVTVTATSPFGVFDQVEDKIIFHKIHLPIVSTVCNGDPDPSRLDEWWDSWGGRLAVPRVVAESLYISPTLSVPPLCGNRAFLLGDPNYGPSPHPEESIPVGESGLTKTITTESESPVLSFWYRMVTYDIKGDGEVNPLDTFEVMVNGTLVFTDGNPRLHSSRKCHDMDWNLSRWRQVVVDLDPSEYGNSITLHFANWNRDYCDDPNKDSNNTYTYLDNIQINE